MQGSHALASLEKLSKTAVVQLDTDKGVESYGLLQKVDKVPKQSN